MANKLKILDGKTIERAETPGLSPYSGEQDESRIVLHLTDGSMIEIVGGGDDCDDWISAEPLSQDEQSKRLAKAAERKAEKEEAKRKHEAWMALTCEQRQAELAKREPSLFTELLRPLYFDAISRMLEQGTAWERTPERTVTNPCPKCHERECPNAPQRIIPAKPGLSEATSITFVGPQRTRARRS